MPIGSESKQLEHPVRETEGGLFRAPLARTRGSSRVAGAVAITAVLYGIMAAGRLAYRQWDPTFFIVAGNLLYDQSQSPQNLIVRSRDGYDGQYYYRLALDPFTNERAGYGITIDSPSYRGQRVLYPVLAHIVALGRISWVPWSMIVVNYLAVCGLAFSAARLAELFAVPAIYGLAIPFFPGVVLGLVRDLPDPLAISLMVFSLLLLHSRRTTFAACMLALAVLARETTVLLAGALFLHSVWRSLRKQSSWIESIPLVIPLATYAAWQLWMLARWGKLGLMAGHANVDSFPLWSVVLFVAQAVQSARGLPLLQFLPHLLLLGEVVFLGEMILFAAIVSIRSAVDPGVKLAWLIYLVLAVFLSGVVWVDDWAFMRGCGELMVLGFIIVMGARTERFLRISLTSTIMIWLALAFRAVLIQ